MHGVSEEPFASGDNELRSEDRSHEEGFTGNDRSGVVEAVGRR